MFLSHSHGHSHEHNHTHSHGHSHGPNENMHGVYLHIMGMWLMREKRVVFLPLSLFVF